MRATIGRLELRISTSASEDGHLREHLSIPSLLAAVRVTFVPIFSLTKVREGSTHAGLRAETGGAEKVASTSRHAGLSVSFACNAQARVRVAKGRRAAILRGAAGRTEDGFRAQATPTDQARRALAGQRAFLTTRHLAGTKRSLADTVEA